jgi:hypothetical protein
VGVDRRFDLASVAAGFVMAGKANLSSSQRKNA